MAGTALVVGASGIVGSATAALARRTGLDGARPRAAPGRAGRRPAASRPTCRTRPATAAALRGRPSRTRSSSRPGCGRTARPRTSASTPAMVRNLLDGLPARRDGAARRAGHRASSTISGRSRPTARARCRRRRSARSRAGSTSRTSTTRRRTRSSPPPRATASPGASTGRTR